MHEFCTPLSRIKSLPVSSTREEVLRFARRHRLSETPLYERQRTNLVGFVRTIDLLVQPESEQPELQLQKLERIKSSELFGEALLQMQTKREAVSLVVGENGESIGVLSIDQLRDSLLKGPLGSLRR